MSVVLRGFTTPWAVWARRWFDQRMQPTKSPLWLADCGRDGDLVGPFVDPQGRVRDEIVHYPTHEDAERELNIRPTDWAPWRPWLKASLDAAAGPNDLASKYEHELGERIEAALAHLRVKGGAKAYIREIIPAGIDLVTAIAKLRAGPADLPPEFQAKLAERDRRVDAEARERLTGRARGES
jgi:hypothetical protein